MKFRVERSELSDAVAWTARSLSSKAMVPILSGLLMEADSNGVRMSTYDLENSASVLARADVVDAGAAVVHGRLLTEIARTLPNAPVEVVLDGSRVVMTCGSTRMTLPVFNVEDFPSLPAMPDTIGSVEAATFASAVTPVAVAAGARGRRRSDESDANPVVRKGSLWRTARAVGWSFFGVRRTSGFEGDVAQPNPLNICVVGRGGRRVAPGPRVDGHQTPHGALAARREVYR